MRLFLIIALAVCLWTSSATAYEVSGQILLDSIHSQAQAANQQNPEILEAVLSLEGIQAEHYLKRRLPKPEVAREMNRIPGAALILMNLYLQGFDSVSFSGNANRDAEYRAMHLGVLSVAGRCGHPLAGSFLIHVAENELLDYEFPKAGDECFSKVRLQCHDRF